MSVNPQVMSHLVNAMEELDLDRLIEFSLEAQKLGLHKEVDLVKFEFAKRKITILHRVEDDKQSQSFITPINVVKIGDVEKSAVQVKPIHIEVKENVDATNGILEVN
jgi:hypothetical protein